jgi:hypothetical protein
MQIHWSKKEALIRGDFDQLHAIVLAQTKSKDMLKRSKPGS